MHGLSSIRDIPAAPGFELLRSEVGSGLLGLALPGTDDTDLMGVYCEPSGEVTGLGRNEHFTWRTQPEGVRSGPDDIDVVCYGLRKYMRLALAGNPTVVLLLWAPAPALTVQTDLGEELQDLAPAVITTSAAERYAGYLRSQRERADGSGRFAARGRKGTLEPSRQAKAASHMLRLGLQGLELMRTGRLELPMPLSDRERCLAVKLGEVSIDDAVAEATQLEAQLLEYADGRRRSALNREPDRGRVEAWMHSAYQRAWQRIETS